MRPRHTFVLSTDVEDRLLSAPAFTTPFIRLPCSTESEFLKLSFRSCGLWLTPIFSGTGLPRLLSLHCTPISMPCMPRPLLRLSTNWRLANTLLRLVVSIYELSIRFVGSVVRHRSDFSFSPSSILTNLISKSGQDDDRVGQRRRFGRKARSARRMERHCTTLHVEATGGDILKWTYDSSPYS